MASLIENLPEQLNAASVFVDENIQQGRGDNIALFNGDETLTYQDVSEMVNKTGNALKNLGINPEDRVMLLLLDSPEFVASFFGAIKIGAVPIPTNTMLKANDFLYFLNDSGAKTLIVHDILLPEIEKIKDDLRYLRNIIVAGNAESNYLSFNELINRESSDLEAVQTCKDDAAFWLYSSGSTGSPKGVVHLHHDMFYCSDLYAKNVLGLNERDISFSAAKLFFAYGLGNSLYFPFRVGASAILYPEKSDPEKVFQIIERYKPTLFYGVPTLYAKMLQSMEKSVAKPDMETLRLCISAGEALPAELFNRWKNLTDLEILDGIGSTEALHIFISNRQGEVKPGSSGKIVPGYEAKIVDENGIDVKTGEIGNLMIKGDSNAPYYWRKHDKTKKTMIGEWLHTGDKYYKDAEDYFWHCGRSDDMMKVSGMWVSPVEIENILASHEAVLECAVVGNLDEDKLVKPKGFVVLKDGLAPSSGLAKELQKFVLDRAAPYKHPRWIEFIESLPRTATGKVQRFKLRE
jgi:benzoate-CoA ligase family protein